MRRGRAPMLGASVQANMKQAQGSSHPEFRARFRGSTAIVAVGLQGGGLVLGFLAQIVFARVLGSEQYGVYTFILSWGMVLAVVARLGLPTVVLRFLPEYVSQHRTMEAWGLVRRAAQVATLVGFALALLGASGVAIAHQTLASSSDGFRGIRYVIASDPSALIVGLFVVPLLGLLYVQQGAAQAMNRIVLAFAPLQVLRHAMLLAAVGLTWLVAGSLKADGLLLELVIVLLALSLGQRSMVMRILPQAARRTPDVSGWPMWATSALALVGAELSITIIGNADTVILGMFARPHDVGIYSAAARTALLGSVALNCVTAVGAPVLSRLLADGDMRGVQATVRSVLVWSVVPSGALWIGLVAVGGSVLKVFGPDFESAYTPLIVLLTGQLVNAATGPVSYLLNLSGRERLAARVYAVAGMALVAVDIVLALRFGPIGAAVGTAFVVAGSNLWLAAIVKRELGIDATVASLVSWRKR